MKITTRWQDFFLLFLLAGWGLILAAASTALAVQAGGHITEEEDGFYYTIQKGDTLWDLSQRFNNSPWLWPDLWSENTQITNPHWLYPGERIRLERKKSSPADTPTIVDPEIPPPDIHFRYSSIDQVGFIRKPAVTPLGSILKSREDKELISRGDLVYIRPTVPESADAFLPGTLLMVYRQLAPTDAPDALDTIGTQHFILGTVEIIKSEARFSLAKVLQSFHAINAGDLIMAHEPGNPEIMVVESTPGIDGRIITSENHTRIMGDYVTAFIDKGEQDGIEPGQIYSIYYQDSAPEYYRDGTTIYPKKRETPLDIVEIGSVLVLRTEQTTANVVIINCDREIKPGQPVRTP